MCELHIYFKHQCEAFSIQTASKIFKPNVFIEIKHYKKQNGKLKFYYYYYFAVVNQTKTI